MTANLSGHFARNRLVLGLPLLLLGACSVGPGTDKTVTAPDPGPSAGANAGAARLPEP